MNLGSTIRAEFTKFFTTSTWWILALVTVVFLAVFGGGFAAAIGLAKSGQLGETADAAVLATATPTLVYGLTSNLGYVFALLLGVLLVTNEYRHRTLATTFLATPRRGSVLTAKVIVGAVLGAGLAVLAIIADVGAGAATFAALGQDTALTDADNLWMLARTVLAFVLWVWFGLGFGAILRNQIAAIVAAIVLTQLVEKLVRTAAVFVPQLATPSNYLPSSASDSLVGSNYFEMIGSTLPGLEWWVGALVLAGYAVVLIIIGTIVSARRDVD